MNRSYIEWALRGEQETPDVEATFVIRAHPEVMERIVKLLSTMRWLGGIGASREIKFGWDGDGHERLNMTIDGKDDTGEHIDPCQFIDSKDIPGDEEC